MRDTKKYEGEIFLLLAALIWGAGYPVIALGFHLGMGPVFINASRFVVATVCSLPMAFKYRHRMTRKTLVHGTVLGILSASAFLLQTIGQMHTTIANTSFITGSCVVLVPFATYAIAKRAPNSRSVAGVLLSFLGIGLLTLQNGFHISYGDFIVGVAAVIFAFYNGYLAEKVRHDDPRLIVFVQVFVTAFIGVVVWLFSKEEMVVSSWSPVVIIYLGIASSLLAGILFAKGMQFTTAARATIIVGLEAPIGSLLGVLLFGEIFTFRMTVGALIMIFAIFVSENILFKRKEEKNENP